MTSNLDPYITLDGGIIQAEHNAILPTALLRSRQARIFIGPVSFFAMNIFKKGGTFCILNAHNLVQSFELGEKSTVIPFDFVKVAIIFF